MTSRSIELASILPGPNERMTMTMTDQQKIDRVSELMAHAVMGTQNYYPAAFSSLRYTDGVRGVAEICGAHWLIDAIASHQRNVLRKLEQNRLRAFQVWVLKPPFRWIVTRDGEQISNAMTHNECWRYIQRSQSSSVSHAMEHEGYDIQRADDWTLECWNDTPDRPADEDGPASILLAKQKIAYTDFPPALLPFTAWVEGDVLLLPAEH